METKSTVISDINIIGIRVIKNNIDTTEVYLENPTEPHGIGINFNKEIGYNFEAGRSRFRLYFQCVGCDENQEEIGLSCEIGVEFHFQIDNFEKYISEENGEQKVSLVLGVNLASIAYSTARGIVLEKTQSTFFNGIILPVIDAQEFLLQKEENENTSTDGE